ncbi:NtaA/DmoA family FMN-dependent monooxygenase [Acrocarpospora catenulata]|uniref:NtaA/DmoA family FMN-dependent monooxygenase n=1 Tax=Acrocarpospora catenulata TaxID=2836182 RepID=UPI001BD9A0B9|nr:NtaA/DmoA family FMN-dependent monooxygenase [Acrocarpospora catenulata]
MSDRLRLFALKQATPGHTGIGLWRNPRSQAHRYGDLDYAIELARQLEDGGFDGVFFADAPGVLDVYQGRVDPALRDGLGTPAADPIPIVAAMAAVTTRLDLAVTMSTSYVQPYALARTMGTLDRLSGGRIGWNIVTSALDSGARNLGLGALPAHDVRYDIAEEFMEAVYGVWESSWDEDAVVRDTHSGVYVDPARVRPVAHAGRAFRIPDVGPVEPSPQRTPVLFQAGSSERGLRFAGRHAEGVFLSAHDPALVARQVQRGRKALTEAGRSPTDAVFLANATFVVAPTDAEAARTYREEYLAYASHEGALARYSALLGIDLSQLDPDEPLKAEAANGGVPAIQGIVDVFTRLDPECVWTPRAIGEFVAIGGGGPVIVGSPGTVADRIEEWTHLAGVDGFNVADPLPGVTLTAVCAHLIPELRRRGLVSTPDPGFGTFRERLSGRRGARLRAPHPAAVARGAHPMASSSG